MSRSPKSKWHDGQRRINEASKYSLQDGILRWRSCSGVPHDCVNRIRLWSLRRDDHSGILIGACVARLPRLDAGVRREESTFNVLSLRGSNKTFTACVRVRISFLCLLSEFSLSVKVIRNMQRKPDLERAKIN